MIAQTKKTAVKNGAASIAVICKENAMLKQIKFKVKLIGVAAKVSIKANFMFSFSFIICY